jgi:hypothetical protein
MQCTGPVDAATTMYKLRLHSMVHGRRDIIHPPPDFRGWDGGRGSGGSGVQPLGRSFGDLNFSVGEVREKLYISEIGGQSGDTPGSQPLVAGVCRQ